MSTIKEIIRECVLRKISVELAFEAASTDAIAYIVRGFAKSGNAKLFENAKGVIEAHLRYNTIETVEDFEGLARLCFRWCENYKDRGYEYGEWADTFEKLGWIQKVVEIPTTAVRILDALNAERASVSAALPRKPYQRHTHGASLIQPYKEKIMSLQPGETFFLECSKESRYKMQASASSFTNKIFGSGNYTTTQCADGVEIRVFANRLPGSGPK